MGSKLHTPTWKELIRILLDNGCTLLRQNGSHQTWYSPINERKFTVAVHPSQQPTLGTAKQILNSAGIDPNIVLGNGTARGSRPRPAPAPEPEPKPQQPPAKPQAPPREPYHGGNGRYIPYDQQPRPPVQPPAPEPVRPVQIPAQQVPQVAQANASWLRNLTPVLGRVMAALEVPSVILGTQSMLDMFDGGPINPLHTAALRDLRRRYPNEFRDTGRLLNYMEQYINNRCHYGGNLFDGEAEKQNCIRVGQEVGRAFDNWARGHHQALQIIRDSGNSFLLEGLQQLIPNQQSYLYYKNNPQQLVNHLGQYFANRGIVLQAPDIQRMYTALERAAAVEKDAAIQFKNEIDALKRRYPEQYRTSSLSLNTAYAQASLVSNVTLPPETPVGTLPIARLLSAIPTLQL